MCIDSTFQYFQALWVKQLWSFKFTLISVIFLSLVSDLFLCRNSFCHSPSIKCFIQGSLLSFHLNVQFRVSHVYTHIQMLWLLKYILRNESYWNPVTEMQKDYVIFAPERGNNYPEEMRFVSSLSMAPSAQGSTNSFLSSFAASPTQKEKKYFSVLDCFYQNLEQVSFRCTYFSSSRIIWLSLLWIMLVLLCLHPIFFILRFNMLLQSYDWLGSHGSWLPVVQYNIHYI